MWKAVLRYIRKAAFFIVWVNELNDYTGAERRCVR